MLLDESLARLLCSEELMSVSAEDSAAWSEELISPELTSDCSSFCSF